MSAWDLHKAFPEADLKVRSKISVEYDAAAYNHIKILCFWLILFSLHFACNHSTTKTNFTTYKQKNTFLSQVVPDAGHSANEPGIAAELVAANEKLKNLAKKNKP